MFEEFFPPLKCQSIFSQHGVWDHAFPEHLSHLYSLNTIFLKGTWSPTALSSGTLGRLENELVMRGKTLFITLVFRAEACELILLAMVMIRRWEREAVCKRLQSQRKAELEETKLLFR